MGIQENTGKTFENRGIQGKTYGNMGKQGETKGNRKISEDIIISRQDTWENIEKQGKQGENSKYI